MNHLRAADQPTSEWKKSGELPGFGLTSNQPVPSSFPISNLISLLLQHNYKAKYVSLKLTFLNSWDLLAAELVL